MRKWDDQLTYQMLEEYEKQVQEKHRSWGCIQYGKGWVGLIFVSQ